MNWKELEDYNCKILDTIPIENYLESGKNLWDVMDELERDYGFLAEGDSILQGELFNQLGLEEFADYIRNRYNIAVYEVIAYKIGACNYGTNA